jgi:hypothetical protein
MEERDEQLWKLAKKRARNKKNGLIYIVLLGFFWIIWLNNNDFQLGDNMSYAWPKWPTLGFLIAWVIEYIEAHFGDQDRITKREYEKLIGKK